MGLRCRKIRQKRGVGCNCSFLSSPGKTCQKNGLGTKGPLGKRNIWYGYLLALYPNFWQVLVRLARKIGSRQPAKSLTDFSLKSPIFLASSGKTCQKNGLGKKGPLGNEGSVATAFFWQVLVRLARKTVWARRPPWETRGRLQLHFSGKSW